MKKVALLLSGNLRTFYFNDSYIVKSYMNLIDKHNIDVFIYTDNNDFNINDVQYFSDNNSEKILGIVQQDTRYYKKSDFINYENASNLLNEELKKTFGDKLKKIYIEKYDNNLIDIIFDKNNINHKIFMENIYSDFNRKRALMCQFYKLFKCFNLLVDYENENNFKYDIIIKSRPDGIFNNLSKLDFINFNYDNTLYCGGHHLHIYDWWAIFNRFIMEHYCNYYLNISQNLVDKIYLFVYHIDKKVVKEEVIYCDDVAEYKKNFKNYDYVYDLSDSTEFGLTYLIKNKLGYNTTTNNIYFDLLKFYN
jgi:hypothetical protein